MSDHDTLYPVVSLAIMGILFCSLLSSVWVFDVQTIRLRTVYRYRVRRYGLFARVSASLCVCFGQLGVSVLSGPVYCSCTSTARYVYA